MHEDDPTPSFDLPPPDTIDERGMADRIAGRLFPGLDVEATPSNVGRYRIVRLLGRGGMGRVFAAEDPSLGRTVALKLLRARNMSDAGRSSLLAEARALASLSHVNIVQVYEVSRDGDDVYFTMEYVDGQTLEKWQAGAHRGKLLQAYLEAGRGLAAAHAAGLIHGDFKPSNVLVGNDGRIRVADFGLARHDMEGSTEEIYPREQTGPRLAGTPGYIAPELIAGQAASAASDQYAYCVSLWHASSGIRPFDTDAWASLHSHPKPVGHIKPAWLRRALLRGLAAEPHRRWPSVTALLRHIEHRLRRRRVLAILVPVPLLFTLGAAALTQTLPTSGCGYESLDDVWNGDERARLRALDAGLRSDALADEIDAYASAWVRAREDICEAHDARHELSTPAFDRANACLRDLHGRVGIVVDTLLAQSSNLEHGEQILDMLDSPNACWTAALEQVERPPSLVTHAMARATAPRLDAIEIALATGRTDQAMDMTTALAARLPHGSPENVKLTLLRGLADRRRGEIETARAGLERAVIDAERIDDDELHHRALRELAELLAYELDQTGEARFALALAEGPLAALGYPAHLVADTKVSAASVAEASGEHENAETLLREALTLQDRSERPERIRAATRLRIANAMANRGQADAALALYELLRAEASARLGPAHPGLGPLDFNIGLVLVEIGDWAHAKTYLESALERQRIAQGPQSLAVAKITTTLAEAETELGNTARAIDLANEAIAIQARLPIGHIDRVAGLSALAWAYLISGRLAESLDVHRALENELPDDQRAALHTTIGWLSCRLDRCEEAGPSIAVAKRSPIARVRAKAWLLAAELELERDHIPLAYEALAEVEGEIASMPKDDEPEPQLLAELAWMRARLALAMGDEPERLEALIAEARSHENQLLEDQRAELVALDPGE